VVHPRFHEGRYAADIEGVSVELRVFLAHIDDDVLDTYQCRGAPGTRRVEEGLGMHRVEGRIDEALVHPVIPHPPHVGVRHAVAIRHVSGGDCDGGILETEGFGAHRFREGRGLAG